MLGIKKNINILIKKAVEGLFFRWGPRIVLRINCAIKNVAEKLLFCCCHINNVVSLLRNVSLDSEKYYSLYKFVYGNPLKTVKTRYIFFLTDYQRLLAEAILNFSLTSLILQNYFDLGKLVTRINFNGAIRSKKSILN